MGSEKLTTTCGAVAALAAVGVVCAPAAGGVKPMQRLKVSDNHRFLVKEDGTPFFSLGDTCWGMIRRASLEDTDAQPAVRRYFENRAAKGFTVIQTCLTGDGASTDAYGHKAFRDGDFSRPLLADGPANDYWDTADAIVALAEEHGLYLGLLPIWASSVPPDDPMSKDPAIAYRYGRFVGGRYGHRPHIVWVLGGDPWQKGTDVDVPERLAMIRAMAEGIADGVNGVNAFDGRADYSTTLMTYHPKGGNHSSSEVLHREPWLDFNMIQTTTRFNFTNYKTVAADYALTPPKPTFDAEVAYEASLSLSPQEAKDRRTTPWEARKAAYWNVFAGGLGHTYGHRSFIGWVRRGDTLHHGAVIPWYESLDAPGAFQVVHLRRLMESRPFLARIPDQSLLAAGEGDGLEHAQATRASDGSYAMVYMPTGNPVTLRVDRISGAQATAYWFDPREGTARPAGTFPTEGTREFTPPSRGEGNDWVLVVDDAARDRTWATPGR